MNFSSLMPWTSDRETSETKRRQEPVRYLHNEMNRLFDEVFRDFGMPMRAGALFGGSFHPTMDLSEHDDDYVIRAELPGMEQKDIDVSLADGVLTVSGEKKQEDNREENGHSHHESSWGQFQRRMLLPGAVKEDQIEASFKNGVLSIRLPKAEDSKARRIDIKG